jgi:putative Ca2+/H+ antiporter (TMEM165/GDT1 family)
LDNGGPALTAFWIAFAIIFVAELGDKTQFMTLSFSTRFRWKTVMLGVFVATVLISLISTVLGVVLGTALPFFWINLLAGLAFIAFGLWALRGETSPEAQLSVGRHLGPLMTVAIAFFIAELGDRTMLATIMIASRVKNFVGVWLGSTIGLLASNALAIIVGNVLGKKLPDKALKYGAATIFIASGLLALFQAWKGR